MWSNIRYPSKEALPNCPPAIPHRNKETVTLEDKTVPVRLTAKRKHKQIDFQFDGREQRGLEQNPDTKSRWAKLARDGKKVMQFLERGKYVGVVADGKVRLYQASRLANISRAINKIYVDVLDIEQP